MQERTLERFAGRTHHHRDFDAADLAARKDGQRTSVSVVIPARNEEATVAAVVGTLRMALQEQVPLIDELLVVDGDSEDATAERARRSGARVVQQSDVLSEHGTAAGKGEALWKGVAASSGDLVAFVDADIHDIDPRFVVGLLGPLLHDPAVAFTKAAYDRPFKHDDRIQPTGGGRVTELLARPLLAAFWPQLAWLTQPLSGEYAGRRSLLESLPFVGGYGVELALLVDIADQFGVDGIAQVDLGRRVHDHQPLESLGQMAAEILHVALDRLSRRGRLVLTDPLTTELLQPFRDSDGDLGLRTHHVEVHERPPISHLE